MRPQGGVLPLQKGIIYGPVVSRRLGRSLGINLMPSAYKACSYNCVYCHYGWTEVAGSDMRALRDELPTAEEVGVALSDALKAEVAPDYITFSGNGEPTLHPAFPEIVDSVVALRDRLAPKARTCVLSNGTGLATEGMRKALEKLDVRIFKLDAGDEQTWRRINRPATGISFAELLAALAETNDWVAQALFCAGSLTNCTPQQLKRWMNLVGQLRPRAAQIYSIDRPAAHGGLKKVPLSTLREIAAETHRRTGVVVHVYGAEEQPSGWAGNTSVKQGPRAN